MGCKVKTETFTDNTLLDKLTRLIDRAKYYDEPITLASIEAIKFDAENTLACLEASSEEAIGDANQEGFNEGKERMFDIIGMKAEELDPEATNEGISALIKAGSDAL